MAILALETQKYAIKIDNFEGPLDLLCHLIDKNKMNIYDINLSEITDQYIEFLKEQEKLNLEIASEFVVMASTLLFLKSKNLLPKQEEEEEEKQRAKKQTPKEPKSAPSDNLSKKRKLSFKEQQEMLRLEQEIESLTNEKTEIESALSSGSLSTEELVRKSERISEVIALLDEKEMRWLELSEI